MSLGKIEDREQIQQKSRKWLSIHHGIIELSEQGVKSQFSYVEGCLGSIYMKQREYGGEKVNKWFIDLRDADGELYTICFPYSSGTFKGIVNSLASAEGLTASTTIKIQPFQKDNYTNVVVYADGVKLDWAVKQLPPVTTTTIGEKVFKDDFARMELIKDLIKRINSRIEK